MDFISGQTLLDVCEKEKMPISEVMKQREITCGNMPAEEIEKNLQRVLQIMKDGVEAPIKNLSEEKPKWWQTMREKKTQYVAPCYQEPSHIVWRFWRSMLPWDLL